MVSLFSGLSRKLSDTTKESKLEYFIGGALSNPGTRWARTRGCRNGDQVQDGGARRLSHTVLTFDTSTRQRIYTHTTRRTNPIHKNEQLFNLSKPCLATYLKRITSSLLYNL